MNGSMLTLGHRLWGDGSGLAKIAFSTDAGSNIRVHIHVSGRRSGKRPQTSTTVRRNSICSVAVTHEEYSTPKR
jgi:hypothetical protein